MDPSRHPAYAQQRPSLTSAPSSGTSSASQSSSSLSSLASSAAFPASASSHSQYPPQASQPAASPMTSQQQSFQHFGALHPSSAAPPASQNALERQTSYEYRPARNNVGAAASDTAPFLSEYSLVAEAAKRAQMAVLMRDLESCEL